MQQQTQTPDPTAERELASEIGAEVQRRRGEDARRRLADLHLLDTGQQSRQQAEAA